MHSFGPFLANMKLLPKPINVTSNGYKLQQCCYNNKRYKQQTTQVVSRARGDRETNRWTAAALQSSEMI